MCKIGSLGPPVTRFCGPRIFLLHPEFLDANLSKAARLRCLWPVRHFKGYLPKGVWIPSRIPQTSTVTKISQAVFCSRFGVSCKPKFEDSLEPLLSWPDEAVCRTLNSRFEVGKKDGKLAEGNIHVAGNGWYSHIATCYDCCPSHRPWRCWEAQLTNHENHRNRNIMWHNWHRFSETTTRALWQTHIFHQGGISTHHLGGFAPLKVHRSNFVPTGCCFCISAKVGSSTTGSSALWQVAAAVFTGTHL